MPRLKYTYVGLVLETRNKQVRHRFNNNEYSLVSNMNNYWLFGNSPGFPIIFKLYDFFLNLKF